jgi:hypothetical protein
MNKWNDDGYNHYMSLSPEEREAIQALFHGSPEEALTRIGHGQLPPNLTRSALISYDGLAFSAINSGRDVGRNLIVYGRVVGVQEFRRELIAKTLNLLCTQ